MDGELIKKALCFHGKPMQKIWDDERGSGDLQTNGVPEDGNYGIYMERQKYFTFQDRAKRLKLHQFLARKAIDLYDKDLGKSIIQSIRSKEEIEKAKQYVADIPGYEVFIVKQKDKVKRHIYESIKPGDIIYAYVQRGKTNSLFKAGLSVFPLCTGEPNVMLLHEYKLRATVPFQFVGTLSADVNKKRGISSDNEYLCCEVIEFSVDAERVTVSLLGNSKNNENLKLGLITQEELPQLYRKISENTLETFEDCLKKAKEFENPNYEVLYTLNNLDITDNFSLMTNLKYEFPPHEYAKELRQVQASKWAFRSVAEGIEYFKVGQHVEAFQCLNKALNIDPRNVEGLVARGALYANKGSFLKAVEDFEKALKLNAYHVNARKYMGETLVALGRSYEEDNRVQEAAKAYRDCLNIIPNHEQARLSLEIIQQRTGASVEPLKKPPHQLPMVSLFENPVQPLQKQEFEPPVTTIQSSSNDEGSSEGSSDSDTEDSGRSLSPLSKKMALHSATMDTNNQPQQFPPAQFNRPFYMTQAAPSLAASVSVLANEFKLDDDDTESRVQKLLQEAMKHKKEKKKSKKSKKSKKPKKESKPHKDVATTILDKINFQDAYNILGGGLKIESTLNSNLKMYEKTIQEIRRRQEILEQSTSAAAAAAAPRTSSYRERQRSKTPTPPPPPIHTDKPTSSTYVYKNFNRNNNYSATAPKIQSAPEPPKLSFQIKKPVKVDKFGLIRLISPVLGNSPTPSPPVAKRRSKSPRPRSRRYSRSRSRSRNNRRRISRSRSRSISPRRRGYRGGKSNYRSHRRRSYSNSRSSSRSSNSRHRSKKRSSRSKSRSNRRSPSPFVPRGTPSPNSRYRRSRSPRFHRRSSRSPERRFPPVKYGNRTWQRPDFKPRTSVTPSTASDGKWLHDKFEEKNDGPSIEEIDEIISKAQKERKQDIINRDKGILKKTNNW